MIAFRFLILAIAALAVSCGSVKNRFELVDDDVYFSKKENTSKAVIIPDVDVDKIMREHPSKVDPTKPVNVIDEGTANPNAAVGYPAYKAQQDSLYKLHPELSGYYEPYQRPPFDLNEERKMLKQQARMQRRLARANRNYNSYYAPSWDYGWNNGYQTYNNNWGWNQYNNWNTPGWNYNFGWNNWNGFNYGFGYNNGWNNWNNGFGWNNPGWGYNYPYNNYYRGGRVDNGSANPPPPVSRPREMMGTNVPQVGESNIPQSSTPAGDFNRPQMVKPDNSNPNVEPINGGGSLRKNEGGNVQYIPPANYQPQITRQSYSGYERSQQTAMPERQSAVASPSNDNNVMQRQNIYDATPNRNVSPAPQQPQQNNMNRPQQEFNRPSFNQPSQAAPAAPSGGGGNSGSGGSKGFSRPR